MRVCMLLHEQWACRCTCVHEHTTCMSMFMAMCYVHCIQACMPRLLFMGAVGVTADEVVGRRRPADACARTCRHRACATRVHAPARRRPGGTCLQSSPPLRDGQPTSRDTKAIPSPEAPRANAQAHAHAPNATARAQVPNPGAGLANPGAGLANPGASRRRRARSASAAPTPRAGRLLS